ncbi:peptidase inhibitor family I36 protein [Kitasatospora sp. NPDC056327]|uniref:peptidase inhibitor family I36 protein n=1 Tax=Kitasatospora sp. NPDC056327 TaxID=3345785 RepID=UPI0035DA0EE1
MSVKKTASRLAVIGATAALAVGGLGGQANASFVNIDSWNTFECNKTAAYFCLWYGPNHTGGKWTSNVVAVPTISGNFSDGNPVRNNAASAENASACNVGIWVYPNYMGDENWLSPEKGGNLTPYLRNNEASMALDDATRAFCPTV